jgi:hypothetical protein
MLLRLWSGGRYMHPGNQLVIPNEAPRFFFPAAVWRARDAVRDLLFAALSIQLSGIRISEL